MCCICQNVQLGFIFVGTEESQSGFPPSPFFCGRTAGSQGPQLTYIREKVKGNAKVQPKYK